MEQLLYWLAGGIGVPLIQALKKALGLEGRAALWLTVAVSAVLGVAALLLTRSLTAEAFTPEGALAAFGQALAAATLAYKLLVES
jgi:hypothetical protein